jgi:hypothetical protein
VETVAEDHSQDLVLSAGAAGWVQANGPVRTATENLLVGTRGTPPGMLLAGLWRREQGYDSLGTHMQLRTYLLRTPPILHGAQALLLYF